MLVDSFIEWTSKCHLHLNVVAIDDRLDWKSNFDALFLHFFIPLESSVICSNLLTSMLHGKVYIFFFFRKVLNLFCICIFCQIFCL